MITFSQNDYMMRCLQVEKIYQNHDFHSKARLQRNLFHTLEGIAKLYRQHERNLVICFLNCMHDTLPTHHMWSQQQYQGGFPHSLFKKRSFIGLAAQHFSQSSWPMNLGDLEASQGQSYRVLHGRGESKLRSSCLDRKPLSHEAIPQSLVISDKILCTLYVSKYVSFRNLHLQQHLQKLTNFVNKELLVIVKIMKTTSFGFTSVASGRKSFLSYSSKPSSITAGKARQERASHPAKHGERTNT